jgi:hypothetical protein
MNNFISLGMGLLCPVLVREDDDLDVNLVVAKATVISCSLNTSANAATE